MKDFLIAWHNHGERFYLAAVGCFHRGKFMVDRTTRDPAEALGFASVDLAMYARGDLWGGPWEVIHRATAEIIDHKLYAQTHKKS